VDEIRQRLDDDARAIHDEDVASCRAMGAYGATLVPQTANILTHCNAGALATAGYGTALGVIRAAVEQGKTIAVLADETRPFLQGARLTAWELVKDGIDTTVITDNRSASMMRLGHVDLVVVGADRIAANGDVANKVGTYGVAVLAKEHGIPFYVAAPMSTVDLNTPDGAHIPIEERNAKEVTHVGTSRLTPEGARIRNPAFDVTPAKYVTAIVTERGIATAPYAESLAKLAGSAADASPQDPADLRRAGSAAGLAEAKGEGG
jgi:methylthioribose-1-phosphate isomerase